jgi:hypothetical protein
MMVEKYWWKTTLHRVLTAGTAGLAICLLWLLSATPAKAQEFTFHLEPAVAFWLDEPQSTRFSPGFYGAVRPGVSLGRVVGLQWTYAMLFVPAGDNFSEDGTAHFLMAGIRIRPFGTLQSAKNHLGGLFADFNIGYVRTGELDRLGLDAGLGYGFQVASWFSLGPVVRYAQIFQSNSTPNVDSNDGQFLTVGLDLGFGAARKEARQVECQAAPECVPERIREVVMVPAEERPCCDGDQDGVCDDDDRCPLQPGPASTFGCPIDPCSGKPLIVVVQFKYDSSVLPLPRDDDPQTMDPVLDAVAKAIAQDPSCRVCVIGHASEEGAVQYNIDLSKRRSTAVQDYLVARGLIKARIPATGMGAKCQMVPESSRTLNRRVEFRRLQEGESCPTDCLE